MTSAALDIVAKGHNVSQRIQMIALDARAQWVDESRPKQLPPTDDDWDIWAAITGRGFGKTRMFGEDTWWDLWTEPGHICHLVGATRGDVKSICIEGESGLLACMPHQLLAKNGYNRSDLTITLINGSVIRAFGAEEENRFRGPQCHSFWGDEVAAWQDGRPDGPWDMAMMGVRLGARNKVRVSTTPRPIKLLREMVKNPRARIVTGTTDENRANLSRTFFANIEKYRGTKLGDQELLGKILDTSEDAIVSSSWWKIWPIQTPLPWFEFIMVSMDTAFTERTFDKKTGDPDPTACTVWGVFGHKEKYHVMLIEAWDDFIGFPDLVARARKELRATYGQRQESHIMPMYGASPHNRILQKSPDLLIIEDKGSGISLRQTLEAEGIEPYAYNPGRADKLLRLHIVSHLFKQGRVWVVGSKDKRSDGALQPASWARPCVDEVSSYAGPGTTEHDDYLDTTTQALRVAMAKFMDTGVVPDPTRPKRDDFDPDERKPAPPGMVDNPYMT